MLDSKVNRCVHDYSKWTTLTWAVNVLKWVPEADDWKFLLEMLPTANAAEVQRFRTTGGPEESHCAYTQRLLQTTGTGVGWVSTDLADFCLPSSEAHLMAPAEMWELSTASIP